MADERTLARRYARALLDVAIEKSLVDEVERDLYALAATWRTSRDLRTLVAHPSVHRERKKAAIGGVLGGKVSALTIRFVEVLLDKGRFDLIVPLAVEFDVLSDEAQGIAKLRVTVYMPLTDGQRERLVGMLLQHTGRKRAVIDEAVDPKILGGIVVRYGDQVLDGSLAGRLRKMREHLVLREDERAQQAAANAVEALRG